MRILSQHKFARHEINQLEADLLKLLDWQLNPPTSFTIARDLIHAMGLADQDQLVNDVLDFLQDATEGGLAAVFFSMDSLPFGRLT